MTMKIRHIVASQVDRDFIAQAIADPSFTEAYAGESGIAGMRKGALLVSTMRWMRPPSDQVVIEPIRIADVDCEMLTPTGALATGLIIYLHGGGFVRGSLPLGRANASHIAAEARTRVLAIGYRQAPEHRFPAAPEDVLRVYQALLDEGVASQTVAVVGESAGGTLALSLMVQLEAAPEQVPAGMAVISPMTDLSLQGASWLYNAHKDVADLATGRHMVAAYLGDADPAQPLASPVHHHFRQGCPLMLAIGSHETMLSDTEYLARKVSEAGGQVQLDIYGGMLHGFTRFDTEVSHRALAEAARWCVNCLRGR